MSAGDLQSDAVAALTRLYDHAREIEVERDRLKAALEKISSQTIESWARSIARAALAPADRNTA